MTRLRGDRDRSGGPILIFPVLDFGGIESRCVTQVREMAADWPDMRVCVFDRAGAAAEAVREAGVPVDVLGVDPAIRNLGAVRVLARYLEEQRPMLIHGCTGSITFHALLAGRRAGVPIRIVEEVGIPQRGPLGRLVFPQLYRLAHVVIGVSQAVVDHLVAHEGVPREKARLVYNAVGSDFLEDGRCANPDDGSAQVISVGRLAKVKGNDVLIEALAPLLMGQSQVHLQIVGDGPERSELEALVTRLGVAKKVSFLGFRSDVSALLDEADVYVLPSRMEGFGLAAAEAMAKQVPIVATRVGGVPEIVPEWASNWLVQPDDPADLRRAVTDLVRMSPGDRARLGARLREHVEQRFSPRVYATQLDELYREQLAKTGAA